MKRKEKIIIKTLIQFNGEIEITTSGFLLLTDIDLTSHELSRLLSKFSKEKYRNMYNVNVYRINIEEVKEYAKSIGIYESINQG